MEYNEERDFSGVVNLDTHTKREIAFTYIQMKEYERFHSLIYEPKYNINLEMKHTCLFVRD